ncbi:MAG: tripartite tricarboxylate transporter TctB family protein [bacterium]|nr:tripartite tricarboxylate transporter TctB family protein [bacterium]
MISPRIYARIEGIVITAIGAVILALIPSQVEKMPGMATQMSPSFFPTIAAVLLIVLGIVLISQSFVKSSVQQPIRISRNAVLRVILAALLLIAYTYLFQHLGFVVTSALFFGIFAYMFGSRNFLEITISMVLVPVVVWLFFEMLFKIPLPHGILF